jgi:hypothetical protein
MPEDTVNDGPRRVQPKKTVPAKKNETRAKEEKPLRQPRLMLGCVYSRQDIIENLPTSPKTFSGWMKRGLQPLTEDTSSHLYLSDEVVEYWKATRRPRRKT